MQMNKHINCIIDWKTTDVLSAGKEVPDDPKFRGTGWAAK